MNPKFISFQSRGVLGIVQVASEPRDTMEFITCGTAFRDKLIDVKEIGESGVVNSILVTNLSGKYVFFMDGDMLIGAKQNRVLNTSVLLEPKSETKLPVSCVEAGRWRYSTQRFGESLFTAPADLRAMKAKGVKESLKHKMGYTAPQHEVWTNVSKQEERLGVFSDTSNLMDVFDSKGSDLDSMLNSFSISDEANGLSVFIRSKLLNTDVFGRTDVYREYFPKLLRSAALSALSLQGEKGLEEAEAKFKTLTFFDEAEKLFKDGNFDSHPGAAAGTERRFDTKELTGFELSYQDKPIHFTALNLG